MTFCNDTDLLHWEPNIFRDAVFASQTLLAGSGTLSSAAFTIGAGSLAAAHIAAGQVLVLSGAVAGSYPIVSIDSTTQMTISALYDGLLPYVSSSQVAPVGAGSLTYTVRTFSPQSGIVSAMLLQAAGILPGTASAGGEVLNPESLRRPCVLGTLQMIYSALSAAAEAGDVARLSVRADLYERLYRRAMRSCHVEIDTDGDGEANLRRPLNVMMLVRA